MALVLTNNATARMHDRGISEADLRSALDAPDHLSPTFEKRWHVRKQINKRTLEVVFWRDPVQTHVITAYWQDGTA